MNQAHAAPASMPLVPSDAPHSQCSLFCPATCGATGVRSRRPPTVENGPRTQVGSSHCAPVPSPAPPPPPPAILRKVAMSVADRQRQPRAARRPLPPHPV